MLVYVDQKSSGAMLAIKRSAGGHTRGEFEESIACSWHRMQVRDPPWLWNPGQMSLEIQNSGMSRPTKRTNVNINGNSSVFLKFKWGPQWKSQIHFHVIARLLIDDGEELEYRKRLVLSCVHNITKRWPDGEQKPTQGNSLPKVKFYSFCLYFSCLVISYLCLATFRTLFCCVFFRIN